MMQRAYDAGVRTMLHACCNLAEINSLLALAETYHGSETVNLFIAFGVHPTEIQSWTESSTDELSRAITAELAKPRTKLRAVGETGLDYYHMRDTEAQEAQRKVFEAQIDLAQKFKLPLIVHTRDAWEDTLEIIKRRYPLDRDARAGVLHCYTGDYDFAQACIERGFYVSWSGILSFKTSTELRKAAQRLPLDRTLVETDCPYLAPQAKRGQRNEPSFVTYVAETLAEIHSQDLEEISKITTANAQRLFGFQ